jgi:hypothetical protein
VRTLLAAVLLAAWLGAAGLLAAAVAPAAFAVLPTRALAGALVGRVLPVLFWAGMLAGLGAAALAWRDRGLPWTTARVAAALGVTLGCAVAQLVIGPRIARLREAIGPSLDALAIGDPQRAAFGRLHGFSVLWMGVAMLAAIVALASTFLAMRQRA